MLLPQSSAFAALKNRLNSVSAIGYLHIAPRTYVKPLMSFTLIRIMAIDANSAPQTPTTTFDRPSNRLKSRDDGAIRWTELLEKFRSVQDKARRAHRLQNQIEDRPSSSDATKENLKDQSSLDVQSKQLPRPASAGSPAQRMPPPSGPSHKPKSSLGNLGRFAGGVAGRKAKK